MVRIDLDPVPPVQVGGHRFAQRQDTVRRGIAVMAVPQRLDRRLDDVLRCLEVGLADAEVDDALALGFERARPRQHFERGLGAEPRQVLGELQHDRPPHGMVLFFSPTKLLHQR